MNNQKKELKRLEETIELLDCQCISDKVRAGDKTYLILDPWRFCAKHYYKWRGDPLHGHWEHPEKETPKKLLKIAKKAIDCHMDAMIAIGLI